MGDEPSDPRPRDPPVNFEQALQDLERRVRELEAGDLPLDRALALYEEGVALARVCQEQLDAAEQRVATLTRGAAGIEEQRLSDREP